MQKMTYRATLDGIGAQQLSGFFDGWPNPPTPDTLYRILKRAYAFVLALNEKGEVVGFIHAISDGILTASIPLLEVRPAYKGQGIGSELVRLLLSQLEGLYMVDTACDDDLVPFYESFGMTWGNAVARRDYADQSGSTEPDV